MKIKHTVVVLGIGFMLIIIGALFKIMHCDLGNELLVTGMLVKIIGGILLLYKLLTHPKFKDFLNS